MLFQIFINRFRKFITDLDNFAYVPSFYITRQPSYKSEIGGLLYITYLTVYFFWSYKILSIFISEFYIIKNVMDILTTSEERNFNNYDIQFGLGLLDPNDNYYNWSDFPGIELVIRSFDHTNNLTTDFNSTSCDESLMYSKDDWSELTNDEQLTIINRLHTYYLCPNKNFSTKIVPKSWINQHNSTDFEIIVKTSNLSMLDSVSNLISKNRPRIDLIWGSYALKFDLYFYPFKTFIDNSLSYIKFYEISDSEIILEPIIIYDNEVFFGNNFKSFKSEINQNQNDGATFLLTNEKISEEIIDDRTIQLDRDENLYFKKYRFKLSPQLRQVSRFRTSFISFITNITAFTSLVLFIFMLIMQNINKSLAKNHLFKGLFSLNTFKNVEKFREDYLNESVNLENLKSNKKINKKLKSEKFILELIQKELMNFQLRNSSKILENVFNNINVDEFEKQEISFRDDESPNIKMNIPHKELSTFAVKNPVEKLDISSKNELNDIRFKDNTAEESKDNSKIELDLSLNNKKDLLALKKLARTKTKKFNYLKLDHAYFELEFCFCCPKKKSQLGEILYENANNYLTEFLDIQTLFKNYQEVDMLKRFFFDFDQKRLFEILSKLTNLPNVFSDVDYENLDLIENYDKNNIPELLEILTRTKKRANEFDFKILKHFNNLFTN